MKTHNFLISGADTDSISYCKHDMSDYSQEELDNLLNEINEISPEYIDWESDGYYKCQIVLKAKNYVLLKTNKKTGADEITYRGSGLKDMKKEPALREFMNKVIDGLLYEKHNTKEIYETYCSEARSISDISRWCVKKSISKKLLNGTRKNETNVLDAIPDLSQVREGDKIYIYNAVDGERQIVDKDGNPQFYKRTGLPKMEANTFLKQSSAWSNDSDVQHYLHRVYATLAIFKNVIDMSQFEDYSKQKP